MLRQKKAVLKKRDGKDDINSKLIPTEYDGKSSLM
jgi:hypothetical protein